VAEGTIAHANFLIIRKLLKNLLLGGKLSSKNVTFVPENLYFEQT